MPIARTRNGAAFLFIAPAVAVLAVVNLFPFVYAVWMSLHRIGLSGRAEPKWVGLANYTKALSDERFWSALLASAQFVVVAVAIEILLGTILAFILATRMPGLNALRQVAILPVMVMPIVSALVWFYLFNPNVGLVNWILGHIGIPAADWLSRDGLALLAIVIADVWQWTPFVMLVMFAAIQSLPEYVFEAAKMDGLGWRDTFFKVTLPLLKPTIVIILLIRIVDSFKTFELVFVMTKGAGGTEILPYYIYLNGFVFRNQAGYAAALSVLMLIVITIVAQFIVSRFGDNR
jgi:multiple sugar transport system permease protein